MKTKKYESGQALVLITVALIGLLGMTGLTVDGGLAYSDRQQAQSAADTAALAAALANAKGLNITNAAMNVAATNGYNDDGVRNIVTVTVTATATGVCPATGKIIKVDITSNMPTTFANVVGVSQLTNKVTASSQACDVSPGTSNGPLYSGNAVYSTNTEACGKGSESLSFSGSSQLQMWGGGLASGSTDGGCVNFKGGEVQLKKSGSGCADLHMASASGTGQVYSSLKPQDGCGTKNYNVSFPAPPANLNITCPDPQPASGSTIYPGNYTGTFPPSGAHTLSPGTYCVDGDFVMNGKDTLSGTGVTIVLNTGGIKWNGNMTLKLSAPISGQYQGLAVYMPPTNSSQIRLNGTSGVGIEGTMLMQNAPCDFLGTGKIEKNEWTMQMICYTFQMGGNYDAQIVYNSTKFYSPSTTTVPPTVELLQ